jgi:hypothetical protein
MLYDWSDGSGAPTGVFFDETLRDGVQAPQIANPTVEQRLGLIDHMVRCAAAARAGLAAARHVADHRQQRPARAHGQPVQRPARRRRRRPAQGETGRPATHRRRDKARRCR